MEFIRRNKLLLLARARLVGYYKISQPVETYEFSGTQDEFRSLIHGFSACMVAGRNIYESQRGNLDGFETYASAGIKQLESMKQTYFIRYGEPYAS